MQSSAIQTNSTPIFIPNNNLLPQKSSAKISTTQVNPLSWERFKSLFTQKNDTTLFLEQGDFSDTKKIAQLFLTTNPFSYNGHLLKQFLKNGNPDQIKAIIAETFNQIFEGNTFDFKQILSFFELDSFEHIIKEDIPAKFAEMAKYLPSRTNANESVPTTIKKTFQVVWRFFPNFLNTALKAFNLMDAGKNPETIWDFAAMFDIYYKIFMIPHAVFILFGSIISIPLNAILATSAVVLGLVLGLCLYLKFRPCPNNISRAENLTALAQNGELDPVVTREYEMNKISSYLGRKKDGLLTNLILVGEPGVGKTEIIKGIAQIYKEKKIFNMSATDLVGGYSPLADVMRLVLLDIKGFENEVILFIDEFGDAMKKNPAANIGGFLKPLLGRKGIQIIAALTQKEYKEQVEPDNALASRFHVIEIKPSTPEQTIAILQKRIETKGKKIRFEKDLAKIIYEATKDKFQPRAAVQKLELAINTVSAFDVASFVPKELLELKTKFQQKQAAYEHACNNSLDSSIFISELDDLQRQIRSLEAENKKNGDTALKIKKLIGKQQKFLMERNNLVKKHLSKEAIFLHWLLLPWIEEKIRETLEILPPEIPMQVDSNLIKGLL